MTVNISYKLVSLMQVFLLTGILHGNNNNSLKVSFELNSINLELSYFFPRSRTKHNSRF